VQPLQDIRMQRAAMTGARLSMHRSIWPIVSRC
jgi:hypothetical protein